MSDVFLPDPPANGGLPPEGSVSLQTWLPDQRYFDEVVRRNSAGARWALVTLNENDEPDDQGALPVSLG